MPAPPAGGREGPLSSPHLLSTAGPANVTRRRRPGGTTACWLAEKVAQGGAHHIGCFFGQEVAGGQRSAANVAGVLLPDTDRLIVAADERLGSPPRQDGALDLLPGSGGLLVVDQVGAGRRTVIRARARDRAGVGEPADVVVHHTLLDARAGAQQRADQGAKAVAMARVTLRRTGRVGTDIRKA